MELRNADSSRCPRSTNHTSSTAHSRATTPATTGVTSHSATSHPQMAVQMQAVSSSTRRAAWNLKLLKSMARHLAIERGASEPQRLCGARQVALELRQRAFDGLLFQLVEIQRRGECRNRRRGRCRQHDVVDGEGAAVAHDHRTLHGMLELADI